MNLIKKFSHRNLDDMFRLILLKNYAIVNLTEKDFCNRFRKLKSDTDTGLKFVMMFKGNSLEKSTIMTASYHEIVFYIPVF